MDLFFNKSKVSIILLILFFTPYYAFAQTGTNICTQVGYSIFTINGINTSRDAASDNRRELERTLVITTYKNEPLTVDFLYNQTHGPILDLLDSGSQRHSEKDLSDIQDSDFAQIFSDASAKVTTQKLLLVGHSQGNFYANSLYDAVVEEPGGVPAQSIGVYAVATPANHVAGAYPTGNANYTTSDTDEVITSLSNVLKPNVHINYKASDPGSNGHSFSKIYLTYEGDKIVSDIKTSLDKLKNNNVQKENAPCITPPKLTFIQKIQGTTRTVLDNSVYAFNSAVYAVETKYMAFIEGAGKILADAVSNIMGNNNSAVIAVDNQLAKKINIPAPVVSIPELPKENPKPISKTLAPKNPVVKNSLSAAVIKANIIETKTAVQLSSEATSTVPITSTPNENNNIASIVSNPPVAIPAVRTISLGGGGGVSAADVAPVAPSSPPTPSVIPPDTIAPVITIIGDNPATVKLGSGYSDPGATARDDVDGLVSVTTSATVDASILGLYAITYTATDTAGNTATATRSVKVSSFVYIPKYTFGTGNGDGKDWQIWAFNGSNIYDWSDTYVGNYLHEQFKMQTYSGGFTCNVCLQRGIFNHNPQLGFEFADRMLSALEETPQNLANDLTYDVVIQWDSSGYTYTISHDNITDYSGHTNIANVDENMWVGWDNTFNNFQFFPGGEWIDIIHSVPLNITGGGGSGMILQPYPVYKP